MRGLSYKLAFAAVVGALYAILTMVLAPISYGPLQFRISEALCVLSYFTPAAAPSQIPSPPPDCRTLSSAPLRRLLPASECQPSEST